MFGGEDEDATFMFECEERIAETAEEDAAREAQVRGASFPRGRE
jgi:hypothetical protein